MGTGKLNLNLLYRANESMDLKLIAIVLFTSLSLPCLAAYSLMKMSLEEKVGQLLMVHFNGEQANDNAKTLVQDTKVGGIIYYNWSNGLNSPEQVQSLSKGLQKLTEANQNPIPLLIATDQEGGVVTRLSNGFTVFPGNKALGETGHPQLAEDAALAMGEELLAVGINMNLAPVVDVNSNPRNPVIGVRSFGEDPETVLVFGKKALDGYKQAGIIAALKHFPGYGEAAVDPHEDLPVVPKSLAELKQAELLPFAHLASSADAIMTAHILVPAFDAENCSTLSEKTLSYLRDAIGFKGIIVADSLVMEGVVKKCRTVDEAAIQALNAGCDLLILGGKLLIGENSRQELTVADVQRIHNAIIQAVKAGRISETRVDQAVERILDLKNRYLASRNEIQNDLTKIINTPAHRSLAQDIASRALKTIKNDPCPITSFREKNICVFAPRILQTSLEQTDLFKIGKSAAPFFFNDVNPAHEEIEAARQQAKTAEVLFICSCNAWKNPSQADLIQSLLALGKPIVLVVTRDPLDASLFPQATLIYQTFSPAAVSIQAALNKLNKKN